MPQTSPSRAGKQTAADVRVSPTRTAVAAFLVALGIAWMAVYINIGADGGSTWAWMADLGRWNFLIGWVLIFLGLTVAAHPATPLGRGRGVVVAMLGCFIIGLAWIVLFYITAQDQIIPLMKNLGNYNLVVGIGFMAVGFVYATHWE
ncbi:MAG TPA: cell division protein CrgA [Nocardioidaceae bacterium]|nr:cell division protein CrgA [Nocardioidaceae bacterium]